MGVGILGFLGGDVAGVFDGGRMKGLVLGRIPRVWGLTTNGHDFLRIRMGGRGMGAGLHF
jgi:hypothetical protein